MLVLAAPAMAAPVYDGLYVLDGNGNVHAVDSAPVISPGINWGWDIARDIALTGNETGVVDGMYLLTGYGDVFAFGNAPEYAGVERPYWGWDIGRDLEPAPDWTSEVNDIAGFYVLDGYGGVFPVGDLSRPYFKVYGAVIGAPTAGDPEIDGYVYWGWDVAEDLEVSVIYDESEGTLRTNGYYILDAYGGVHWCLENQLGDPISTPWGFSQPYFGWDIARSIRMTPTFKGYYLLDGYGSVHAVGDASFAPMGLGAAKATVQLFPGMDIAKDLEVVFDETGFTSQGMVILDGMGGLSTIGNVTVGPAPYTPGEDIFKDIELSPFFTFVTDAVVTGP
jgi:hypothetical protein